MHVPVPMHFDLGALPLTDDEQRALDPDLRAQGLDARYWAAMNGLLTTGSRSDTPLILRGTRGGRLAAVAYLMECRRTSRCLFPGPIGRALDLLPVPAYYWTRGDAAVDLLGSRGFVADGEDRDAFYRQAIAFLNTRYVMGIVMDEAGHGPAAECCEIPMMAWGRYRVETGGTGALLGRHAHLRRKIAKYRNKGGSIERIEGALGPDAAARVLHCLRQAAESAPLRAPFQENYGNMVRWASTAGAPGIVHFVARLDGAIVGYHSFLESGEQLLCLSGGFDRQRPTTYHAYENILLESMRYAEERGLRQVAFGPVGNPSKAALMPSVAAFVGRFYSRHRVIRRAMDAIVPRSALRHARFTAGADRAGSVATPPTSAARSAEFPGDRPVCPS